MARKYYYNGVEAPVPGNVSLGEAFDIPAPTYQDCMYPVPSETPQKVNKTKPQYSLLPYDALEEIVKGLDFGAVKYAARDWEKGSPWGQHVDALVRHISAYCRGEDKDPESGLSHLAHAGCRLLFLLAFQLRGVGVDDRAKTIRETKA